MDSFQDHLRICTKEQEIVTTKNRAILIAIKTILFVGMHLLDFNYFKSNEFWIGPVLYVIFNLVVTNTLFFLIFFLQKFKFKEPVFRIFFIGNTFMLWYFVSDANFYYLIGSLIIDVLLLSCPYLLRKLLPSHG